MRIARKTHALLAMLAIVGAASAAMAANILNEVTGKVSEVRVYNDVPVAFVCFDHDLSRVTCGADYPNCLAFSTSTDQGRAVLSLALAARTSGRPVFARGLDTCDTISGRMHDLLHLDID